MPGHHITQLMGNVIAWRAITRNIIVRWVPSFASGAHTPCCSLQALQELQSKAGAEAGALRNLLLDTDLRKVGASMLQ